MTFAEWFAEYEHTRPKMAGDFAGNLTREDVEDLWEFANGST